MFTEFTSRIARIGYVASIAGFCIAPVQSIAADPELPDLMLEQVFQLADRLADQIHTQNALFEGRSPVVLIDGYVSAKLDELIGGTREVQKSVSNSFEKAKSKSSDLQKLTLIADAQAELAAKKFRRFPFSPRTMISFVISLTLGYLTLEASPNEVLLSRTMHEILQGWASTLELVTLPQLFLTVLSVKADEVNGESDTRQESKKKFFKSLKAAVNKAFFARLAEHGIVVPIKNQDEWLHEKLNNGIFNPFEKMNPLERKQFAAEYANFIQSLASVTRVNQPDVADQLDALASSMLREIEFVGHGGDKIRDVVLKGIQKIAELDKQHRILADAHTNLPLSIQNRMVVEYPGLFDADTKEFIRLSRMAFPPGLQAYAQKLQDLRARIELITAAKSRSSGGMEVHYSFSVLVPGQTQFDFSITLFDPNASRMTRGREMALILENNLEFDRQFKDNLLRLEFGQNIISLHEERYPDKNCRHALSTAAIDFAKTVFEVAH